jgi:membrane protein implicated in regulation of membrane protease activity
MVAEVAAAGGFYIIFFGIAAILVGLLASANLAGPLWVQVVLFGALGIMLLSLFRARLLRAFQRDPQSPSVDRLVGEICSVLTATPPGEIGKVELRGAVWTARNVSDTLLGAGTRCRVLDVDGLTLFIGPEGAR